MREHESGAHVVPDRMRKVRSAFVAVGLVSCVVNLLMLTGPLFMLQVYDRVLTSQSIPTLLALSGLAVGLYAVMGVLDFLRARILSRVANRLDMELSPMAFRSWIARSMGGGTSGYRPIQDLAAVRGLLSSPATLAVFDLPWFPVYLGVVYVLHVQLGLLATAGAAIVVVLALLNEWASGRSAQRAMQAELVEGRFADRTQANADSVMAMGMLANTMAHWQALRGRALATAQTGAERSEGFTAASKSFRLLLQSVILALGAYLAIQQEISAGMIVAASIIAGRALAPIDQTIGGWKGIKRGWLAYRRLRDYLGRDGEATAPDVALPAPQGILRVQRVTKFAPADESDGERRTILAGVEFGLEPGDGLGVIGPSASGKSSLARLLVGLWVPDSGTVRIDGATLEQWGPEAIGRYVGYLPQRVDLISGTIAQNIARFDPQIDDAEVVRAARLAQVHDMVLSFPDGYGTTVDDENSPLTGGQKQRIGLARAVYGRPRLVVLDEPNSNLDAEGDAALSQAIRELREDGSVVVVMAHRPSAISAVGKLLMLKQGRVVEFGDKDDVLRKVTRTA